MKKTLLHLLLAVFLLACSIAVPLTTAYATDAAPETTTSSSSASASGGIGGFLEGIGLSPDLFTDTDFGKIIEDVGNLTALQDLVGLAQDAFATGTEMLQDVANGGKGTSDGSNTANAPGITTSPQPSTIYQITPVTSPTTAAPATTTAAPVTAAPTAPAAPVTAAPAPLTQAPAATEPTTALAVPVTVPNNVNVQEENTAGRIPTLVIVIVLSVITVTLIVCIVVFFIRKKYY